MDIGTISMRYAKALMKYAEDTGKEDELYQNMRMLSRSLQKYADLRAALENPVLPVREKFSLICVATVGKGEVGREFSRFITLLLKKRRENLLQYICLSFVGLYRNSRHIGTARLVTAVPVSREVEERIRNMSSSLLHAHMEIQTEVDPSIEGGFIFDINNYRLDASIATQLRRVKQQFIDKNRRIV